MRSFAKEVKEEILMNERTDPQFKAELSGLLQFLSTISISNRGLTIVIRTENAKISRFVMALLKEYYGAVIETSIVRKMKLNKNKVYLLRVMNKGREILEDLGLWTEEGLMSHPSRAFVNNREMARAYLAGCFLASGSVNDPKKTDYHMEISANREEQGKFILRALKKLGLNGKMIPRRNQFVVYIKSVDAINDFLVHVGANDCAIQYADVRIQRDIYNNYTRLENCATANEVKMIRSGKEQVDTIERLKRSGKFDKLDRKLKETAELRLRYPEESLQALSEYYEEETGQAISKSGMKHRLEKIVELSGINAERGE